MRFMWSFCCILVKIMKNKEKCESSRHNKKERPHGLSSPILKLLSKAFCRVLSVNAMYGFIVS